MLPTQRDEFISFVDRFFSQRYNVTLAEDTLAEWWEDLRNFKLPDIERAFVEYRTDEKLGGFAPKVSQILKLLKGKEFRPTTHKQCCLRDIGTWCDREGKFRVGYSEPAKYVCEVHYDEYRPKSDLDKLRDMLEVDFIAEAKSLGITNRELFRRKNKLSESEMKNLNTVHLLAKLAGKAQ
jgi:hypothetical protein